MRAVSGQRVTNVPLIQGHHENVCVGLYICPEWGGLIWSLAACSKDQGDQLNLQGVLPGEPLIS